MSLGGCRVGAFENPKRPSVWAGFVTTCVGSSCGAEKSGALSTLIASTRIWIFMPSLIRKFFDIPTSNFRNRWLRN